MECADNFCLITSNKILFFLSPTPLPLMQFWKCVSVRVVVFVVLVGANIGKIDTRERDITIHYQYFCSMCLWFAVARIREGLYICVIATDNMYAVKYRNSNLYYFNYDLKNYFLSWPALAFSSRGTALNRSVVTSVLPALLNHFVLVCAIYLLISLAKIQHLCMDTSRVEINLYSVIAVEWCLSKTKFFFSVLLIVS